MLITHTRRHQGTPLPRGGSHLAAIAALSTALLLGACGGEGAGDGAGDGPIAQLPGGPNPVLDVIGTWNLAGNWRGTDGDQALLVIRALDDRGRSRAVIHDFDEMSGCYFPPFGGGTAEPDGLRETQVFLNNLPPFHDAVLTRDGDTLVITYFDRDDTDGNGDNTEQRSYRAPAVALTEVDISPSC